MLKPVKVDLKDVYFVAGIYRRTQQFSPGYTPKQMLRLGVFGGAYFGATPLKHDNYGLFERNRLFEGIKSVNKPDAELNYYGVLSGQTKEWWLERKLITNLDPLGWFHWYCNFYYGRRHDAEDARQIKRWYAFRRHLAQVQNNPDQPRLKQKQALLQWAYEV